MVYFYSFLVRLDVETRIMLDAISDGLVSESEILFNIVSQVGSQIFVFVCSSCVSKENH